LGGKGEEGKFAFKVKKLFFTDRLIEPFNHRRGFNGVPLCLRVDGGIEGLAGFRKIGNPEGTDLSLGAVYFPNADRVGEVFIFLSKCPGNSADAVFGKIRLVPQMDNACGRVSETFGVVIELPLVGSGVNLPIGGRHFAGEKQNKEKDPGNGKENRKKIRPGP
jgi:hypothetical protein